MKMINFLKYFLLIIVVVFNIQTSASEFVVIVHESVKDTASKIEVKQILLANQTTWKNGKKIAIIALAPGADGADEVTKEFMGMTAVQARKHWLTKVFGGVLMANPTVGDSPEEVVDLVEKTANSIAVIPKGIKSGKIKFIPMN